MLREAGLFLIEVHRHQREVDRRALLQIAQDLQHGVAVFAAGQTDHDAVAFFNHIEIGNRFAHVAAQALLQFVQVVLLFLANGLLF